MPLESHAPEGIVNAGTIHVCLLIGLVALSSCNSSTDPMSSQFEEQAFIDLLSRTVQSVDGGDRFDLNSATTFDWAFVHLFGPYTPDFVVDRVIGTEVDSRRLSRRETINLFVFTTHSAEVVLIAEVKRNICDFRSTTPDGTRHPSISIAREQALFRIERFANGDCTAIPFGDVSVYRPIRRQVVDSLKGLLGYVLP